MMLVFDGTVFNPSNREPRIVWGTTPHDSETHPLRAEAFDQKNILLTLKINYLG